MIDNVIWSVSHAEQSTGWVKMTWHSCPHVYILSDTLQHKEMTAIRARDLNPPQESKTRPSRSGVTFHFNWSCV